MGRTECPHRPHEPNPLTQEGASIRRPILDTESLIYVMGKSKYVSG
jgi:hypothetical protein